MYDHMIKRLYREAGEEPGPIMSKILDMMGSDGPDCDAIDEEIDRLCEELTESDELRPYETYYDGYEGAVVLARSADEALARACEDPGSYDTSEGTVWVDVTVRSLFDDEDTASEILDIHPPEPDCVSDAGHDWMRMTLQGHGGGSWSHSICRNCGVHCHYDGWAQDPTTGIQGLTSIRYEDPDEESIPIVLRHRVEQLVEAGDLTDDDVHDAWGVWPWQIDEGLCDQLMVWSINDVDEAMDALIEGVEEKDGDAHTT